MTDVQRDKFERPETTAMARSRLRRRILAGGVLAAVVLGGVFGVRALIGSGPAACGGSHSGLSLAAGECVGVTDGSGYDFTPDLAPIEKRIAQEDAAVAASGKPVVTIAVLEPITVNATSALIPSEIRNDIEGAYTAQYRVNHSAFLGDETPLIRLVLANEGSHEDQWPQVVRQLEGMTSGPAPLVAVAGLGVSTTETLNGAVDLAHHSIATVAAIDTADQLNYTAIRGFIRVATDNAQYVAALHAYLAKAPNPAPAILVYDANSDQPGNTDLFTRSLRDDLQTTFADQLKYAPQSFVGVAEPSQASPDLFSSITANICAVKPGLVLFAGRSVDLQYFLRELESRVCSDTPLVVAAAGSNLGVLGAEADQLRKSRLTVVKATLADAAGWITAAPGTPKHFAAFYDDFHKLGFPDADLLDGGATATHDAVLAAARAVRLAAQNQKQGGPSPNAADVLNQVLNMNDQYFVPGAGGDLSFSYHGAGGAASSNPIGKPLPVVAVPADSAASQGSGGVFITQQ